MTHARRAHIWLALVAIGALNFLKIQTRPTSSLTRLHQAYKRFVCLDSCTLHPTAPDRRAYALGGCNFCFPPPHTFCLPSLFADFSSNLSLTTTSPPSSKLHNPPGPTRRSLSRYRPHASRTRVKVMVPNRGLT